MKYIYFLIISILFLCCSTSDSQSINIIDDHYGGNYLETGIIYLNQSWTQESTGYDRPIYISAASSNSEPHNIIIVLHGGGGNAEQFVNSFNYLDNHIVVAPQGYGGNWNVGLEQSLAPDVDFIKEIINYVRTFENVQPENITILGISNGSALVNRLIIELDDSYFTNAISIVSPLNSFQYRFGSFWYNSTGNNNYDMQIIPESGKRILCISGTADNLIPYNGGIGVMGYNFLSAQNSAFVLAQNMGFQGDQLEDNQGVEYSNNIFKYSYLDGDVVHYKFIGAGHNIPNISQPIIDFLTN